MRPKSFCWDIGTYNTELPPYKMVCLAILLINNIQTSNRILENLLVLKYIK